MANPQTTFRNTHFHTGSFFARKRDVVYKNTLPYQLNVLKSTGRYDAFRLKWNPIYEEEPTVWPVPNHLFWDSDVAKWIEGTCYFLEEREDPKLRAAVDELVEMIRNAQQPDGYLNIHFTVVEPEKRFSNLRDSHELYNAGHLIESALAHNSLYQNDRLLEPVLKYVDLLFKTFGPASEQKHGYPGHPEIELALLRLYQKTKDLKHYDLAKYFLDERGNPKGENGRHYYDVEAERRGEEPHARPIYYPKPKSYWYQQAHAPIIDQQTIEGHSVRATYLLAALADLVRLDNGKNAKAYTDTLHRLWRNMVEKKMYLTGGIGAMELWEGFGIDYFLPQGTDEGGCYAETCAAIGVMMLAERLLQVSLLCGQVDNLLMSWQKVDLNGQCADIMELCLYNAFLTGMSADGKCFTYVNQLASSDSHISKREEWFQCACCPPNVTRLLGQLGGYFWSVQMDNQQDIAINVHMYGSATLNVPTKDGAVELTQESNWPWDGEIAISIKKPSDLKMTLRLRIPLYASTWELLPSLSNVVPKNGYLTIPSDYLIKNPSFNLSISLKPRFLSPHPYTNQPVIALA
ncbi:glycoside hydrolase family 127 protein [Glonium stellatum]|uniref:Glycoside hydrolase family 127 protein n=1 Tax=Glonium stellatum TaxID=574774 RepID=A0A8E2EQ35_9PEZI|nr:glycoside hydrolase family 127 protein [Glonium stellatum]